MVLQQAMAEYVSEVHRDNVQALIVEELRRLHEGVLGTLRRAPRRIHCLEKQANSTMTQNFLSAAYKGYTPRARHPEKGAVIGAITAAAFNGVGTSFEPGLGKVFAHGLVGGTLSAAQGGSFKDGFLSAGFAEWAGQTGAINGLRDYGMVGEGLGRAIIGGAASKLAGGSFEQGATTAAYGYVFNHLGHMLVGTDAGTALLRHLQGRRDGNRWLGDTSFGGLFGRGRADLIYKGDPNFVYETKVDGSDAAGAAQLEGYLSRCAGECIAGDDYTLFKGASSLSLDSISFFSRTTYTYTPSAFYRGVVTYTVNDTSVFDQVLQAYQNRPVGGPSPLPLPRLR